MSSTELARPGDVADVPIGLEDSDDEGLVVPRLKVDNKKAVFVDPRTNSEIAELDVVVLGALRQRVLWHPTMLDGEHKPLCKSWDGKVGFPNTEPGVDEFPWDGVPDALKEQHEGAEANIACKACPLKEFGSHPTRDNTPWCTEQDIWVVAFDSGDAMLLTWSRGSLTQTKRYKSYFKGAKVPMFTVRTRISLEAHARGSVDYTTPIFTRGEPTEDDGQFAVWADQFRTIKQFVQTRRVRDDVEQPAPKAGDAIDAPSKPSAPEAKAPASSGATTTGFDEEPF